MKENSFTLIDDNGVETTYDVLPTIFLKRTFTINGGDGTVSNPYTVH